MRYAIKTDKDFCERSRCARGWSSFAEWGKMNRKWATQFRSHKPEGDTLAVRKNDKRLSVQLADALDYEYESLIKHNL